MPHGKRDRGRGATDILHVEKVREVLYVARGLSRSPIVIRDQWIAPVRIVVRSP
jgi:hypothetical protein